jgi:hypothetical protein
MSKNFSMQTERERERDRERERERERGGEGDESVTNNQSQQNLPTLPNGTKTAMVHFALLLKLSEQMVSAQSVLNFDRWCGYQQFETTTVCL